MPAKVNAAGIEQAAQRLEPVVRRTPLEENDRLTALLGTRVLLKREDTQVCRSYKVRGAYNLMSSLTEAERRRGVVCASAGNHGQGVAFACRRLGIRGRVFVPSNTPRQKRQRIAAFGGDAVELVVVGSTYDEASAAAHWDSERTGAVYVHPFDDARTMEGQGTVAREITQQAGGAVDTVVVPVGGGGLISGAAVWLRAHAPHARIIGAEPAGAASMRAALDNGGPVALPEIDSFVDGAAVGKVGAQAYPLVKDLVDEVVAVDEGAVCTEMLDLYQTDGIIAEPAGALASAAARQILPGAAAGTVVCVVSGGNNDVSRYAEVVERSLVHVGLRHYFLVTFPQQPGALRHFLDGVLGKGEDIVAFEYVKKNNRETGPALVGIELERPRDLDSLLRRMDDSPLAIERISPGSPWFSFLL
ncbi:threonine dehydratase [Streptomyces sp. NRRL F-4489]|uniref:threonine ammonia-lyase IlvA n=1 Tax=Streptomyces sp. NRRL F-4489 TaxID=1609095 RepID=UPI00074AE2D8|nr:threonine ammonia-lyase IlvA [Streptomyces sp. NRRL F-4489]KUL39343.1 threonine dehydratase [Streptomyces sp. NRRL F-4489]